MAESPELSPRKKAEFIATSRERFRLSSDAEQELRKAGQEDDRFRAGEHWPKGVKESRDRDSRPCLTVDKLSQPIRQVTNQQRQARPAIQINPTSGGADVASAEIRQGLIRQIEQHSFADVAYDWAFDGAVSRGWGFFRVLTEYESDHSFDQICKIEWIENPYSVFRDPNVRQWNGSDALWAHIVEDLTAEAYNARYGDRKGVSRAASLAEFTGLGADQPTWFPDGGIRIAEYFYVVFVEGELVELTDGTVLDAAQLPKKLAKGVTVRQRRPTRRRQVKWCLHNALEIIEERDWAGTRIPIVEVEGERLNVDGKRIKRGLIRGAQDSMRMYDYWVSTATETTALAPRAPYIMYEGQDENYEQMWANANTQAFSSLKVKAMTRATGNQLLPLPQRIVAEPPIQAMMAGIKQAEVDIHSVTAFYDASDPRRPNAEQSGRAVLARQQQGTQTNLNFADNFGRSLRYLGEILLELLPKIYDRPGRVVDILGLDDEVRSVMLGQPFARNEQTGQPQALAEGEAFIAGLHEFYDLSAGQYDVTVTVGATYTSRRQEAVTAMLQLVEANPALAPMMADVLVENMDWPGAQKLADRLKKLLPPNLQEAPTGGAPTAEQAQAQLAQAQQMIQELQQQLQQSQQIIQTDAVKSEAAMQRAQMEAAAQAKLEIEKANIVADQELALQAMKNAATIAVAHINAASKGAAIDAHAAEEAQALGHAAQEAERDRAHEAAIATIQPLPTVDNGDGEAGAEV